jgi:hypothetical protein
MIKAEGKRVLIDSYEWNTQYAILEAIEFDVIVIVIFDYLEFPNHRVAKNLCGFSRDGNNLWIAENPTTQSNDGYTNFLKRENGLWVGNFAGYSCQIDPKTGKLIEAIFTK